jgi:ubiquinone/menaquinone biosynthesis C-methylase UbiE
MSGEVGRADHASELPPDYHQRIYDIELSHWWHRGMAEITRALLGGRLASESPVLCDVGCGTGGVLRWALDLGVTERAAGADISSGAIALARQRVPEADLHVAPMRDLPFTRGAFDLVMANDVLQHVTEDDFQASLEELRRVLRTAGTLLVRTNGAHRARQMGSDWRTYDARSLRLALEGAGFHCERITYANLLGSLLDVARGRTPKAPTVVKDGIPQASSPGTGNLRYRVLTAEARWLARPGHTLPYGHTLFAMASTG